MEFIIIVKNIFNGNDHVDDDEERSEKKQKNYDNH